MARMLRSGTRQRLEMPWQCEAVVAILHIGFAKSWAQRAREISTTGLISDMCRGSKSIPNRYKQIEDNSATLPATHTNRSRFTPCRFVPEMTID